MRILINCSQCNRRYNAAQSKIGSRFRCRCGEVLKVPDPRGHDSRVVRCSSCGAARRGSAGSCAHCGADFTLHERDLHTVCPACLTRVSDRANYCHSCGSDLLSEEEVGEQSSLNCPACVKVTRLHNRQLGTANLPALECDVCAGLWLGDKTFSLIVKRTQQNRTVSVSKIPESASTPQSQSGQRSGYRPCPVCNALMNRKHYSLQSGVVIDFCRDHGIWFDSDELARIVKWLNVGGIPKPLVDPRRLKKETRPTIRSEPIKGSTAVASGNIFDDLFSTSWDFLSSILGD